MALRHAAGALLQCGVREIVVIHFPEGGFARTRDGKDSWQSSLKLPPKYIAGTAGAGDAFCAGALLGLHDGWELDRCLEAGVCAAAASLAEPTAPPASSRWLRAWPCRRNIASARRWSLPSRASSGARTVKGRRAPPI